jgi:hypothetical protein
MKPRHFWWLVETLEKQQSGPSLTRDEIDELQALVAAADRGEF